MGKAGENLRVTCPCCQAKLLIDPVLGAVLSHEAHVKPGPDVDLTKASSILEEQKRQREDKFADSFFQQTHPRFRLGLTSPGGLRFPCFMEFRKRIDLASV